MAGKRERDGFRERPRPKGIEFEFNIQKYVRSERFEHLFKKRKPLTGIRCILQGRILAVEVTSRVQFPQFSQGKRFNMEMLSANAVKPVIVYYDELACFTPVNVQLNAPTAESPGFLKRGQGIFRCKRRRSPMGEYPGPVIRKSTD